ncbi:Protein kinase domain containing protein [Aphelenchoides avenae]|nr:Protein kinase domain containing protein [Aphelenchus avenae]
MSKETEADELLPRKNELLDNKRHKYEVQQLIGKGGFGAVYEVKCLDTNDAYAMKCERDDVRKQVLKMDLKVLRGAQSIQSPHFCRIVDRGQLRGRFRFVMMTLASLPRVGRNLWDLRVHSDTMKFSLATSLRLAEQCLTSIEDLHRLGYLHRDIKPGNFAIGRPNTIHYHTVFMLDFGLCRKYVGITKDDDLRLPRETAPFRGTTRYASIAALREQEQSRKDDIEAWLYMVVEWTSGNLPWKKLGGKDKKEVLEWKVKCREPHDMEKLFQDCPKAYFEKIMDHVDRLDYTKVPDYGFVYDALYAAAKKSRVDWDASLDYDPGERYRGPTKKDRDRRINLVPTQSNEDKF